MQMSSEPHRSGSSRTTTQSSSCRRTPSRLCSARRPRTRAALNARRERKILDKIRLTDNANATVSRAVRGALLSTGLPNMRLHKRHHPHTYSRAHSFHRSTYLSMITSCCLHVDSVNGCRCG